MWNFVLIGKGILASQSKMVRWRDRSDNDNEVEKTDQTVKNKTEKDWIGVFYWWMPTYSHQWDLQNKVCRKVATIKLIFMFITCSIYSIVHLLILQFE